MTTGDRADRHSAFPGFGAMHRSQADAVRHLAEIRRSAGLSQTEVAARMGTSQSAVARLESGQADLRMSTLDRYASALGQTLGLTVRSAEEDST